MPSKEELFVRKELQKIFVDVPMDFNYRPDFLKNEKTNMNLEIDIYIRRFNVAVEYQGGIHFKDIKRYRNDSDKSRYSDVKKYDLIELFEKRDVSLVEIFPQDLVGDFKHNFIARLKNISQFYFKKTLFAQCVNLEKILYYVEFGVKFRKKDISKISDSAKERVIELSNLAGFKKMIKTKPFNDVIKNMIGSGYGKYCYLLNQNN